MRTKQPGPKLADIRRVSTEFGVLESDPKAVFYFNKGRKTE